jgi:NADH:ubiquinone oxidoreductase subunit E
LDVATSSREDLLVSLKEAQAERGHLSREVLLEVSCSLEVPVVDVFGVASFYSFLSTQAQGRNIIRVCRSVPCYLKNSQMILRSLADELGIGPGETTPDGQFSCELTNCIGACDVAPAMLVNGEVHGELTAKKISTILSSHR